MLTPARKTGPSTGQTPARSPPAIAYSHRPNPADLDLVSSSTLQELYVRVAGLIFEGEGQKIRGIVDKYIKDNGFEHFLAKSGRSDTFLKVVRRYVVYDVFSNFVHAEDEVALAHYGFDSDWLGCPVSGVKNEVLGKNKSLTSGLQKQCKWATLIKSIMNAGSSTRSMRSVLADFAVMKHELVLRDLKAKVDEQNQVIEQHHHFIERHRPMLEALRTERTKDSAVASASPSDNAATSAGSASDQGDVAMVLRSCVSPTTTRYAKIAENLQYVIFCTPNGPHGDEAAAFAMSETEKVFQDFNKTELFSRDPSAFQGSLQDSFFKMNEKPESQTNGRGLFHGSGTTLATCVLHDGKLHFFCSGDDGIGVELASGSKNMVPRDNLMELQQESRHAIGTLIIYPENVCKLYPDQPGTAAPLTHRGGFGNCGFTTQARGPFTASVGASQVETVWIASAGVWNQLVIDQVVECNDSAHLLNALQPGANSAVMIKVDHL